MALLLKKVAFAQGPRWVAEAFRLYARRPLAFALLFVAYGLAFLVVGALPLVGTLVLTTPPLLSLGFMVAARSAQRGGPVRLAQLVEPLRGDTARRRSLLVLCALYGASAVAIFYFTDLLTDHGLHHLRDILTAQDSDTAAQIEALADDSRAGAAMTLLTLLVALLSVPFWHAPALVHWAGQGVAQALFSSCLALWRSKGAFVAYALTLALLQSFLGVVIGVLGRLLQAPQLMALLLLFSFVVFVAVFYISVLYTFDDSFGGVHDAGPGSTAA